MRSHYQFKRFAFLPAPHHVTKKIVKLNGVEFQCNCLIVEEARYRRKSSVRSSPHCRPHVINSSSRNENNFVPGDVTYEDTAKFVKRSLTGHTQNRITIFGDSITRRIRVKDFSRQLDTDHAKIRTFPDAYSKEFPHYVTPTLEDGNFDMAILNFVMNDLLQNRNQSKAVDELILNLKKICHLELVKNTCFLELAKL